MMVLCVCNKELLDSLFDNYHTCILFDSVYR